MYQGKYYIHMTTYQSFNESLFYIEQISFCFESVPAAFKSYGLLSRVIYMKKGKWQLAIYNYKQPYKNLCFYYEAQAQFRSFIVIVNRLMYIIGQSNVQWLQDLQIFFACITTLRKAGTYVYNYSDLENHMSSPSHTSNSILRWLKIFTLLY